MPILIVLMAVFCLSSAAAAETPQAEPWDLTLGNPNGERVILEFGDYSCIYCRRAHFSLGQLLDRNPGVKLIYRQFPILGAKSIYAAKVVVAVGEQDKAAAVRLHDLLFDVAGSLSERKVLGLAKKVGADIEALKTALQNPRLEKMLLTNHESAERLGIRATPGFVINGRAINGLIPIEDLENALRNGG